MLGRPQPGDSEADLLRFQQQFLAAGAEPAVHVVRRPDKRRGETGTEDGLPEMEPSHRDVVDIPELPDQVPSLTPAPPKKSRFKSEHVHFEDEDPEAKLDRHDTHVTAVLTKIIERDTSMVPVSLPEFTGSAFPKVFHRSEVKEQAPATTGRKSIFAQKIAARRAMEDRAGSHTDAGCGGTNSRAGTERSNSLPAVSMETEQPAAPCEGKAVGKGSRLVTGQGLGMPHSSLEAKKIHQENEARLSAMSKAEILEEQRRLLSQLDPRLVSFVRSRDGSVPVVRPSHTPAEGLEDQGAQGSTDTQTDIQDSHSEDEQVEMENEEEQLDPEPEAPITEEELPVKPQKEWMHMDKLEPEKLEWLRDLPAPRKRGTRKAMQARFDFSGALIPPTADLPTHLGLHHHGEEPELAGYSLQELFLLSRSQVTQQRSLALTTLARVLRKAHLGDFASCLKGSVVCTLLDAGLLFLLRFSLDDSIEGVMAAAVHALWALLVAPNDEECLDQTFSWLQGTSTFPLLPSTLEQEEEDDEEAEEGGQGWRKETAEEKEERKPDYDVAQADVVKGLLRMKLLARLRYILEVVRPAPRVVQEVLEILTRIARHSASAASQVLDCPRLLETVMSEFLPCSWAPPPPTLERPHGLPVAAAMKLVRVLASSGRHACARLLNRLAARDRLSRFLAVEPEELLLEPGEALRLCTEALRLWGVAAGYGQACDLYKDLYPILVKALQAVPRAVSQTDPRDPLRPLALQRAQALLTLLNKVTHTAGCHQELQADLTGSLEGESPPPPPVQWGHVTGLRPFVEGWMKVCVRGLADPAQHESSLSLAPANLLYLGAFYTQLKAQSSFRPVECLQEMESLTAEVLLPLLSHQDVRSMIDALKSCSAVCNSTSCSPGPEAVPSLPGLACSRGSPALRLAGSGSPFPLLTGLCSLIDAITSTHRGLTDKFSGLLLSDSLIGYLRACCHAMPALSHSSAWHLRHEYHLLHLLLKIASKLVPVNPEVAKQASLFHQVAIEMIPWLLPGSEHLAHDLLSTVIFNQDFLSEGRCGGPEAADLSQRLQLQDKVPSSHPSLGSLLQEACAQLPSVRGCYLTHLAHLEPSVLKSRDSYLGRTPWVKSQLLPELTGPVLPSDWAFLPLVSLYEQSGKEESRGRPVETLPPVSVESATHCLQWLLVLETWREGTLRAVPPAAKLCRLACLFLSSSDLFLERPVQQYTWALLWALCRPSQQDALDLSVPPPGVASFHDFYSALLAQFEAVSFGDPLFGCFLLLPLQRRFSAALRLAVFGEHVGLLRSLGVSLQQLPLPVEQFTSPPEDSLALLHLYFRALVTGALRRTWCPVLYMVALAHLNTFFFSQDPATQDVDAARRSLLRKTYCLTDEMLKDHLLLFKQPSAERDLGFELYEQLPAIRARRLDSVLKREEGRPAERD
ncbi:RNA polymerase II-associated protein 1 [Amia ocellicauda]|uniref:RNA polymerase II-associated protein 1 n=1 Tax=Amia ocellicauda TaxID=2972642 RepID=UPI003463DD49